MSGVDMDVTTLSGLTVKQLRGVFYEFITPNAGESPHGYRKADLIKLLIERANEWQQMEVLWDFYHYIKEGNSPGYKARDYQAEFKAAKD